MFKYAVDDNIVENGKTTVVGHFERIQPISAGLQEELLQNGAPKSVLDDLLGFDDEYNNSTHKDYQTRQRERILSSMEASRRSPANSMGLQEEPLGNGEAKPALDDLYGYDDEYNSPTNEEGQAVQGERILSGMEVPHQSPKPPETVYKFTYVGKNKDVQSNEPAEGSKATDNAQPPDEKLDFMF